MEQNGQRFTFTYGTTPEEVIRERSREIDFNVHYSENDIVRHLRVCLIAEQCCDDPELVEWLRSWRASMLTVLGIEEV